MKAEGFAFVVGLILFTLLNTSGPVAAFCVIVEPPTPLPTQVNGTQVEIRLTEGFARIVIIKEFYNPSDEPKQGQIAFPLERGHELITDLRLKIGNVVYAASAQNRSDALGAFLDAIAKGQDAALVQYDAPRDVYWIAVTIPPKEARTTVTTLEMPLAKTDGFYEYQYRLSIDARDSVSYLRVHVHIETVAALDQVVIPSHPTLPVIRHGLHAADTYVNDTNSGGDLRLRFRAAGASLSQFADPSGDRYVRFSLDATDPAFASSLKPTPRALMILVDASGSMGLLGRWDLAKETVRKMARDLRTGETFGVAVFHGATVTPFSPSLEAWTSSVDGDLGGFLDALRPHGSTSLAAPLAQATVWALEARRNGQQPIVVLVSDGRPTRGPVDLELETAFSRVSYDSNMPVFAMGIRPANHDDETVLHNLSHYHGGELTTLYGGVENAVSELLSAIRVPILPGVRAEILGAGPSTFASANPEVVWQGGEAFVIARMRGTTNDSFSLRVTWSDPDGATRFTEIQSEGQDIPVQPLLKRQWVLTRIHALLEALQARADPGELDEITSLATDNRVATQYTSLLVLLPKRNQGGDAPPADGSLVRFPAFGPGGELASPSGSSLSPGLFLPLAFEAQKADALQRDLANSLVQADEVDRYVDVGSAAAANLDLSRATSRYEGTYLRILELDGELVGLRSGALDTAQVVANAFGFVGMIFAVTALARLSRRRTQPRRDPDDVTSSPPERKTSS